MTQTARHVRIGSWFAGVAAAAAGAVIGLSAAESPDGRFFAEIPILQPEACRIHREADGWLQRRVLEVGAFTVSIVGPVEDGRVCLTIVGEGQTIGALRIDHQGWRHVLSGPEVGVVPHGPRALVLVLTDGGPAGTSRFLLIGMDDASVWRVMVLEVPFAHPGDMPIRSGWRLVGDDWFFHGDILETVDGQGSDPEVLADAWVRWSTGGLEIVAPPVP
jgi:hypothetical protein